MAVSLLSGNESPTAAKMNSLWAEADSILDKALDGKSTYLLRNQKLGGGITDSRDADAILYKGTEFAWLTGGTHTAASTSVLYSAFDTLPTHHSQSSYDTAADAATVASYSSDGYAHIAGSSTPNLINSLKVHTRTNSGTEYHIWEYTQPAPEKENKYAVAEYIIGMGSGTGLAIPSDYNKYNCFKLHNLTDRTYTISLDGFSSPTDTFTIPPYSQRCVRRISAGVYDYSYKYFFKVEPNDPRFITFDSHDGSIAQTMRANNITNPSFIYNIFEYVGGVWPVAHSWNGGGETNYTRRITFNPATHNDIGTEYADAGYFPAITDSTIVGDLVYQKGLISYRKNAGTLTTGTIEFDGFSSLQSKLVAVGLNLTDSAITHNYDTVITGLGISEFNIWPKTTNLLQVNDVNAVRNMASGSATIQTNFLLPFNASSLVPTAIPKASHALANLATPQSGIAYSGRTKTVGQLKTELTSYSSSNADNRSVILTTEGPYLLWLDKFSINGTGDSEGFLGGFSTDYRLELYVDGLNHYITVNQEWQIALRLHAASYAGSDPNGQANYLYGYTSGWPSMWKDSFFNSGNYDHRHVVDNHKFHRMFEGPRKTRLYETATPITAGTETFKHNDYTDDPKEESATGADVSQTVIGGLTETEIAFQTNDIDQKVSDGDFDGGEINHPNYPRTLINDPIKECEDSKTDSSLNQIITPSGYTRLNLLKEHYNDFATILKKSDKIRPLAIDEVYFGEQKLMPSTGYLFDLGGGFGMAPLDLYEGFEVNSDKHDLYTALGVDIKTEADFPSSTAISAAANNTINLANGLWWNNKTELETINAFRWVTINDVKTRALALGFEFRFEELAAPYRWGTYYYPNGDTQSTWLDGFCTTNSSTETATWKGRIRKGYLSGDWYTWAMGAEAQEIIALLNGTGLVRNYDGAADPAVRSVNHGLVLTCVDTSRTNTAARANIAIKPIYKHNNGTTWPPSFASNISPTVSKSMSSITDDQSFHYPDRHHHCAFFIQTTPPVTHSA